MEGPLFSTKAESHAYRQWGMDIIGMTALPEAKLAREAELCYATIACATDYDCWHESEESVTVEMVMSNLGANIANAQRILQGVAHSIPSDRSHATLWVCKRVSHVDYYRSSLDSGRGKRKVQSSHRQICG